jgi:hypothetical protein
MQKGVPRRACKRGQDRTVRSSAGCSTVARKRAVLAALIERIEVRVDQIDIRLRPSRLGALLDGAATPSQGVNDEETEILSVRVRLRRAGREIRMVIDGTDPFAAATPDARLSGCSSGRAGSTRHSPTAKVFLLPHSSSGKVSAGPISLGSSASAISRRISPRRPSMGASHAN